MMITHQYRTRPHGVDSASTSPLVSAKTTTGMSTQTTIAPIAAAIPARSPESSVPSRHFQRHQGTIKPDPPPPTQLRAP